MTLQSSASGADRRSKRHGSAGADGGSALDRGGLLGEEPMTGIEPAYSAWEADVLPLNYIGMVLTKDSNSARVVGKAVRASPRRV